MKLRDATLFCQKNFVGGEWIKADNGNTIDVVNPSTLKVVGSFPNCSSDETCRSIDTAEECFSIFRKTTPAYRSELLENWFDLIIEAQDDLARIMTLEQDKPLAEARDEISYAASFAKRFAEEGKRVYGSYVRMSKENIPR